jgi:hypothetical protein
LNNHTTGWRPLTCPCTIEYDDNINWQNSVDKCDLHKEFTGKTLLEEVLKHNRENSPKGEPNTIEGIWSTDIEPDRLGEVDKPIFRVTQPFKESGSSQSLDRRGYEKIWLQALLPPMGK